MAHTPAPWQFVDSPAWGYSALWNPETRQEILVPDGRNEADRPETWMGEELTDDDKALILAAPQLLAALKALTGALPDGGLDPIGFAFALSSMPLGPIKDAIQKARAIAGAASGDWS